MRVKIHINIRAVNTGIGKTSLRNENDLCSNMARGCEMQMALAPSRCFVLQRGGVYDHGHF